MKLQTILLFTLFTSMAIMQPTLVLAQDFDPQSDRPLQLGPDVIRRATESVMFNKSLPLAPFNPDYKNPSGTGIAKGKWITVDTRDYESCRTVSESLQNLRSVKPGAQVADLCQADPENPIVSILIFEDVEANSFRQELNLKWLKGTDRNIVNETRNLTFTMVGMMGLLWYMPESVTKWNKEEIRNQGGVFEMYKDNIKAGPVIDKDDWYFNWIGHPISGAAYYVMARHSGLTKMESFGYSVMMSTFFWEYGFEAVAEIPSIQDIIITPVIGSLLGELFYRAESYILMNDQKVAGSKALGKFSLVVLNPMGSISTGINKILGSQVIQNAKADLVLRRQRAQSIMGEVEGNYIGFEMRFLY